MHCAVSYEIRVDICVFVAVERTVGKPGNSIQLYDLPETMPPETEKERVARGLSLISHSQTRNSRFCSWRRAADFCAACRGSAEAEVQPTNPSVGSTAVGEARKRSQRWMVPRARRMECSLCPSARVLRPPRRRRTPASRHRVTATASLCSAVPALERLLL